MQIIGVLLAPIISAVIGTIIGAITAKRQTAKEKKELQTETSKATRSAVLLLLRDKITDLYNEYLSQGHLDLEQKQKLEKMYTDYKTLGGDGVITNLYEEMK